MRRLFGVLALSTSLLAADAIAQTGPSYEPVDILVLYTDGVAATHGVELRDRVDELVGHLNGALIRAGRVPTDGPAARVVTLRRVDYQDDAPILRQRSNQEQVADDSTTQSLFFPTAYEGAYIDLQVNGTVFGDLSNTSALRDGSAADIVVLLLPTDPSRPGQCGRGTFPFGGGISTMAHAVVVDDPSGSSCPDFVFAHEVGHVFGLRHENDPSTTPGVPAYARAWENTTTGYQSIMTSGRTPFVGRSEFSNPSLTCLGQPCGLATRDSARALREDPAGVTGYRTFVASQQVRGSIAPLARAVQSGNTIDFYASITNPSASASTALNCGIELPGAGSTSATVVSGTSSTTTNIGQGSSASYYLTYSPSGVTSGELLPYEYYCDNRRSAEVVPGVNAPFITVTSGPTPDVFAASTVGSITDPIGSGFSLFGVATTNVAATGSGITVELAEPHQVPELGSTVNLPLTLLICETDPATGLCLTGFTAGPLTLAYSSSQNRTFAVAVNATAAIPNAPSTNRVFVVFRDSSGRMIGGTSVAVQTP